MSLKNELKAHIKELSKLETPFYIYSEKILKRYAKKTFETLSPAGEVFYALKANANPRILEIIRSFGFGADCVSGNEVKLARKMNFRRILFSGVGKTEKEIREAKNSNAEINAESLEEIELISELIPKSEIGIRINPGIDAHTHRYITTGTEENKFGIPLARSEDAFVFAKKTGLEPVRIHFHLGSQIFGQSAFLEALEIAINLADELSEKGVRIREIDMGGGFGISYENDKSEFLLGGFASEVKNLASEKYVLLFEPGRFVVARSGAIVTRVLYRKSGSKNFIVTDCGMNDFIRPALYGAKHRVVPLSERSGRRTVADVVGPICESADFLAKNVEMNLPERGDLLAVLDTGAYGYTMASNYNLRCKPAEHLLKEDGEIVKIREKICPEI